MGSAGPVLHVLVIGFHHKKGNQVEFSYPPLIPGNPVDSNELPDVWKHLPSLALPDGAHNYKKDTVYFHLPSKEETSHRTVYGVSCYRQMDATELLNRGADVTRNSVQKSVCVLSTLPLYGLIEAKLELITHAYFKERDFSEVSLLEDTYTNLNHSLSEALVSASQVFLGLSCRDVVRIFRNRILVLFKMMLLERRVLFFASPVKPTVNLMLTVLSLFPGMIEHGLAESASYSPSRQISPTLKMTRASSADDASEGFLEVHYTGVPANEPIMEAEEETLPENQPSSNGKSTQNTDTKATSESVVREQPRSDPLQIGNITHVEAVQQPSSLPNEDILSSSPVKGTSDPLAQVDGITYREKVQSVSDELHSGELEQGLPDAGTVAKMEEMIEEEDACFSWEDDKLLLEIDAELDSGQSPSNSLNESSFKDLRDRSEKDKHSRNNEPGTSKSDNTETSQSNVGQLTPEKIGSKIKDKFSSLWQGQVENGMELQDMRPVSPTNLRLDVNGFPLSVFTKGVLCHPYLCLQYYDLLSDVNVRGFVIGATNALFKQKKHMINIIVELLETEQGNSDGRIEINDPELRKQLSLSTADLRFADAIAKAVIADPDDTEWEGGDEWIRSQFKSYITSLLATAKQGDEATVQDFNPSFIAAWKTTHNYKVWRSVMHEGLKDAQPSHPCHGQIGVGDFRLKIAHTMQSTEKGKKINAALGTTGRAVVQTGKAVGGAFTFAKKSVSSWFTGKADQQQQKQQEDTNESNEETTEVQKVSKS